MKLVDDWSRHEPSYIFHVFFGRLVTSGRDWLDPRPSSQSFCGFPSMLAAMLFASWRSFVPHGWASSSRAP